MTFVQTSFLITTAAVVIPIVVHLLSRRHVRRVELGTMRFLQDIIQDGSQQRRLRRWLLLTIRSLVMLLLALLFSRPYLVDQLSGRSGSRSRIILIDRSASMSIQGANGRLVDDAVVAATDAAKEAGDASSISYAWFDQHVKPIPEGTLPPTAPRTVTASTNYGAAVRWASTAIDARPDSVVDVVMITDMQQNGLQSRITEMAASTFPSDVPVKIVDVGREAVNNLAISQISSRTSRVAFGNKVEIDVTLINYGSLPYEAITTKVVAFDGNKSVRLSKSVKIAAGEAQELVFDLGKLNPGTWHITASVDVNDDLVIDNQRLTAVEVASPTRVIVFDGDQQDSLTKTNSYYVATALAQDGSNVRAAVARAKDSEERATEEARFAPEIVNLTSDAIRSLSPEEVPLAVVCDPFIVDSSLLKRLQQYVEEGGRLLVFAGDTSESQLARWQQSKLVPGLMKQPIRSGAVPFRIVSINPSSQMMKPFDDPQHADLSRLAFRRLLPVQPAADTRVVAWFDESRPAITEHAVGQGRIVWFLSGVASKWSNWTASPLYLPVVQQMAAELLNLNGEGRIRHRNVGDDDHRLLTSSPVSNSWTPVSTSAEPTNATQQPDDRQSKDQQVATTLVYTSPGFQRSGQSLYVINTASQESDFTRIDVESLGQHFGMNVSQGVQDSETRMMSVEKKVEYWPWLAAGLFVLVFAEFCLSNRTTV